MMSDSRRLRPAEDTLAHAVAGAVESAPLSPEDQGAKRLAEQYAEAIDAAEDRAKALEVLGPKLLSVLDALNATPAARARVAKAVTPRAQSRLDLLRETRRS